MKYLVIYSGRFHPFHLGHKASYEHVAKKYGADSVYIATSDKQDPVTSPFSYADKVNMITRLGIPASHVLNVTNPYKAQEYVKHVGPEQQDDTVLIFVVSEKDMTTGSARFRFDPKKNGEPSYLQPMPKNGKKLKPMTKHAYLEVTPKVNFRVQGRDADSASEIRKLYRDGNDSDRQQIIVDLYGRTDPALQDLFDQRLGVNEPQQGIIYGQERVYAGDKATPVRETKQRIQRLLENMHDLQQKIQQMRRLQHDYIDERGSRKK
jgi:phosphopantetheine adenylyltransferase